MATARYVNVRQMMFKVFKVLVAPKAPPEVPNSATNFPSNSRSDKIQCIFQHTRDRTVIFRGSQDISFSFQHLLFKPVNIFRIRRFIGAGIINGKRIDFRKSKISTSAPVCLAASATIATALWVVESSVKLPGTAKIFTISAPPSFLCILLPLMSLEKDLYCFILARFSIPNSSDLFYKNKKLSLKE